MGPVDVLIIICFIYIPLIKEAYGRPGRERVGGRNVLPLFTPNTYLLWGGAGHKRSFKPNKLDRGAELWLGHSNKDKGC